jgi:hypothetical protein
MNNYKMNYTISEDNICGCGNDCPLFCSSYGNMITNIIHEELTNKLHKLKTSTYQIFTNDRKIYHVKWYEMSSVLQRRALDSIIVKMLKPDEITHYDRSSYDESINECPEFNNTFDFQYAHKFYNTLKLDKKFNDLTSKYQDVCAFNELRNTEYEYLTLYTKYKKN